MSTNLHIIAVRDVRVIKTGNIETQEKYFKVWQTPTEITCKILDSTDPIGEYKKWVLSVSEDHEVNIYEENDVFNEGNPIGVEIENEGVLHIDYLNEWIKGSKDEGYDIICAAW